jgi:hypothetical protein
MTSRIRGELALDAHKDVLRNRIISIRSSTFVNVPVYASSVVFSAFDMVSQPPLRDGQGPGSHISGTWPGTRNHAYPRGIANSGSTFYMNSALQNLAHLPKLCNWIVQHNDPTNDIDWPCRPDDFNRHLPPNQKNDKAIQDMGEDAKQCVACLTKNFILEYWKNKSDLEASSSTLQPFRNMASRWFCQLPLEHGLTRKIGELDDAWIQRRLDPETESQRNARVATAKGQQDSDEFLMPVLEGIRGSIDPT